MHFIILAVIGIAMLIGGIFLMRYGLKKLLWFKLQKVLQQLTVTPWRGMIVGTIAAAVMQSSTAVSLITIGLVSAEYMSFYQGLGIILGANIGTCSTVQLMTISLSEQYLIPFLMAFSLIALISRKFRYPSLAICGLISMFTGLTLLSDSLETISKFNNLVHYLIASKSNPLFGILGGIVITLLFQSSSAATGVLMLLASDGIVDLTTSAYVVYGNNIGSCLSSVVIAAGAPLAAKRVAMSHIVLNVLGVMVALPFTPQLIQAASGFSADFAGQVAFIHTFFNIVSSIIVVPIAKYYAKLIVLLVPSHR
ncbi:MAG: Na/Pi cotransporter family protein [Veillonellaceae bacterium]|nr:Na/Pi cotransporter family protein [Veillonellaceae bacterium]